ncbi:MAG TPA: indole-3-glycerol phosphate synthase TrpC [Candidatus Saccharimonadales bacterium]
MKTLKPDTKLSKIIESKKVYLAETKRQRPYDQLEKELESIPPFKGLSLFEALKSKEPKPKLIAEVKKASPSRGVIRENFLLEEINDAYQAAPNVVAISVLTEKDHFHGSEATLAFFAKHNTHHKPLLRKDFIFDKYQILETKLLGAQAYLLIASLFDDAEELEALVELGYKIGLEPLVEVHDQGELDLVKSTKARIVGVNCRDLKTFSIDIKIHELLRELDDSYARIAESGIDSEGYLKYISTFCDAALVGSHFMSQQDIEHAIRVMVNPQSLSEVKLENKL